MSLNVLIICENHMNDPLLIKPIISALFKHLGKPKTKIAVNTLPIHGYKQALNPEIIRRIYARNSLVDLFLLLTDRDGRTDRWKQTSKLELESPQILGNGKALVAELAIEEVEIWVLAGLDDLPSNWKWEDVRGDVDCKEWLSAYSESRGHGKVLTSPLRMALGERAAANFPRVRQLCADDLGRLESRIEKWLEIWEGTGSNKIAAVTAMLESTKN